MRNVFNFLFLSQSASKVSCILLALLTLPGSADWNMPGHAHSEVMLVGSTWYGCLALSRRWLASAAEMSAVRYWQMLKSRVNSSCFLFPRPPHPCAQRNNTKAHLAIPKQDSCLLPNWMTATEESIWALMERSSHQPWHHQGRQGKEKGAGNGTWLAVCSWLPSHSGSQPNSIYPSQGLIINRSHCVLLWVTQFLFCPLVEAGLLYSAL